ncbi:PCYCGC motif-containing (lipo)protein [Geoalkalibacter sp.]|uniref:PCYCGC motif-containing (lipo)protein n=1 Tax=Geoalkalibacter sp. TaxID=3041440 RepID=UPI00272E394E|nr:PCYCGC motif-containing (lipo)protein [Geoalkalibacter sp.]
MWTIFQRLILCGLFLTLIVPAFAGEQEEFDRILNLGMSDLTREAQDLLDRQYPDEDWDAYRFPRYVFTSDSVETGYMIAVKEPELLRQFKCYCFCDTMGHTNLLDCFVKKDTKKLKFDDHGASCNICYGQAMMALLWQEKGFTQEQMQAGFEKRFERLIEQFGNR